MNDLIKYAASFIKGFDLRESKMRQIIRECKKISDEVKKMQKTTESDQQELQQQELLLFMQM